MIFMHKKFYKESNEFKKAIFDTYFREAIEDAYNTGSNVH